jgi:tRNA threonylcarbamoyladenosine biosynthesis protein TsaE
MSPILGENALDFISHSAEQTRRLGTRLGALLKKGDAICLSGELGVGKTRMASGLAAGWGASEPASSPTFVMVHEHTRTADSTRLYHVDCYRMRGVEDLWPLGWDDMLDGGSALVIEWPETIRAALPRGRLWITLSFIEEEQNRRHLLFEASGKRHQTLLEQFRRRAFGVVPAN